MNGRKPRRTRIRPMPDDDYVDRRGWMAFHLFMGLACASVALLILAVLIGTAG